MNPSLYILMRTDMASMNAGKGMAQAAHAANQFLRDAADADDISVDTLPWEEQARGFGTTITLAVPTERAMKEAVDAARAEGFIAGVVHDSTYPLRDGKVTHLIPVDTCAYVFTPCRAEHPVEALAGMSLHP
ncbi:peptidyl tRNA hydrolase [Ruegeria phage RpAliso]|nr:peptidyl tRNA hydrolase [Ruegeria phage RpAliso]